MKQIVDVHGQPLKMADINLEGRQTEDSPETAWLRQRVPEHPARGLNPARLYQILEEAEQGQLVRQSELFADMEERDSHIQAEMSKRRRAVCALDWTIQPPPNASAKERKMAQALREMVAAIPDLEDVLFDMLDGIGHGFAALEIQWARIGAGWTPGALTHRPQSWFTIGAKDRDEIRLSDNSIGGQQLWPLGWVVHKHKARSGWLARSGLHRNLVWPYLFKNFAVRDWAEFLEIYGLPMRIGKYPPGSSKAEKAALLRAVVDIGHSAAGIMPDGMAIEFKEATRAQADPFEGMVRWAESSQSKLILGATLTAQADGKSSTHALGNVHNEVRHDIKDSDARQLASTLTRDLVYPLALLNFGLSDPSRCPRLVFDTREPADLKLYSDALPELVGLGMQVPVDWVHDKLAIPQPEDGQAVLVAPRPEMALPPELRPLPNKPQNTAAARYRAMLRDQAGNLVYPDQAALDAANLDDARANAAMDALIAPLVDAVRAGASAEEVAMQLQQAYPDMDDDDMVEMLARAMFVSEVWGRINADS